MWREGNSIEIWWEEEDCVGGKFSCDLVEWQRGGLSRVMRFVIEIGGFGFIEMSHLWCLVWVYYVL